MRVLNSKAVRLWVPPVTGFVFYGAWALLINSPWVIPSDSDWLTASKAAFTQGSYSFVITLVLAAVVEWLFVKLSGTPLRSVWVCFVAMSILIITSAGINILAGTPHVLWTILPGLVVSAVYTGSHVFALKKLSQS